MLQSETVPARAMPPTDEETLSQFCVLYSNQPIISFDGRWYTRLKNFTDFLGAVARLDRGITLVLPVTKASEVPRDVTEMGLPGADIVEARGYEGHGGALRVSLGNALCVLREIRRTTRRVGFCVVGLPAPNSTLLWISLLAPRTTKFVFFVRGDTVRTVSELYRGSPFRWPVVWAFRFFRRRVKYLARVGRATVCVFGRQLAAEYGPSVHAVHVVWPILDRQFLDAAPTSAPAPTPSLAWRLLSVGRLSPEKNLPSLIRAVAILRARGVNVELTIVGFGGELEKLRQLAKELDVQSSVQFLGYVRHGPELIRIYDTHQVFCLTSFTEGTPRVVVEALARGLSVCSTPIEGFAEEFQGALRFTGSYDAEAIAEAIAQCIEGRADSGHPSTPIDLTRFTVEGNAVRVASVLRAAALA